MQGTDDLDYECGYSKVEEKIVEYQKALDSIWDYINHLERFGCECKCEEQDADDTFDTIDYTGDIPNVNRWCLICGGYRCP